MKTESPSKTNTRTSAGETFCELEVGMEAITTRRTIINLWLNLCRSLGSASAQSSRERWQLHKVIQGNRLRRLSGFAPGSQSADDHERVEAFFPQQVRHPGAGRFARSSTVQIYIFVLGQALDLFLKIVGFDSD